MHKVINIFLTVLMSFWAGYVVISIRPQWFEPVHEGQLWYEEIGDPEDPFQTTMIVLAKVIEIRDDYVLYERWDIFNGQTYVRINSLSKRRFVNRYNRYKVRNIKVPESPQNPGDIMDSINRFTPWKPGDVNI